MDAPTCFSDKLASSRKGQYKEIHNLNTSIFTCTILKIPKGFYKYITMDVMAIMILTYTWLKFTDMALITLCVDMCIRSSNIEVILSGIFKYLCRVLMCPVKKGVRHIVHVTLMYL